MLYNGKKFCWLNREENTRQHKENSILKSVHIHNNLILSETTGFYTTLLVSEGKSAISVYKSRGLCQNTLE